MKNLFHYRLIINCTKIALEVPHYNVGKHGQRFLCAVVSKPMMWWVLREVRKRYKRNKDFILSIEALNAGLEMRIKELRGG